MKLRQGGDFIEKPASLTLDIELHPKVSFKAPGSD